MAETGINFPSNDGFDIQLDFSAIWGVMPADAAPIVRMFGNIDAVEEKVIEPQSESICSNNGSKMGAVELLIGESREAFQTSVSEDFQSVLSEKNITLLYGLVRVRGRRYLVDGPQKHHSDPSARNHQVMQFPRVSSGSR